MSDIELSVVATLYRSEQTVEEFCRRVMATTEKVTSDFEMIFVDDGSPDASAEKVKSIAANDRRVTLIELSKNFGHHPAIVAGLTRARGKYVFLIDCDLEEPPEVLEAFWNEMRDSSDIDMVFGVQERRKGGLFERVSGELFWKLFRLVTGSNIPANTLTVRLMTRRYLEALSLYPERELFLGALMSSVGFGQKSLVVQKQERKGSSYSGGRKLKLFLNAITSFSSVPLIFIFYSGTLIATFAFLFAALLVAKKLIAGEAIQVGWTSVIASIWFIGGIVTMSIGVVGIYLYRIYMEVKQRPRVIVKAVHGGDQG